LGSGRNTSRSFDTGGPVRSGQGPVLDAPDTKLRNPGRFDFEVNRQGIPTSYLDEVADAMGVSRKQIEAKYDELAEAGADYNTLVRNYVDSNPHSINLKEAHLIMGYTTNFFQKPLNSRIFSGEILSNSERSLVNSVNSALDKLPSQKGTYYRGLGSVPDWFDTKYAVGGKVHETHFASVSRQLSPNYPSERVMIFESDNVKDISALAMDTNFAKYIGQEATASEQLIQANSRFIVTGNDGVNVTLRSIK
jgi:hypothetical protein